jgi:TPR repeat protein
MLGTIYHEGKALPRDDAKAFEYFRQSAQSGDPAFQANLGLCYSQGTGARQNYAEAVKFLQPAAENGIPNDPIATRNAQDELGGIYYTGDKHVAKDRKKAMFWFEKAARAGHPHAQRMVGYLLQLNKSYTEALPWLKTAAEQGNVDAQNDLGVVYANGLGVPKSRTNAIAWYLRAYKQGDPYAKENLRKLGVDAK